jgi:hypothetical protein
VAPTSAFTLELLVRRDAGTVGIVLGHHGVDAYPYHTLVDLTPDAITVSRSRSAEVVEPLARAATPTPLGLWLPLRLRVEGGRLTVWRAGRQVLAVPVETPTVSLFGVTLKGGAAAFRDIDLSPLMAARAAPMGE